MNHLQLVFLFLWYIEQSFEVLWSYQFRDVLVRHQFANSEYLHPPCSNTSCEPFHKQPKAGLWKSLLYVRFHHCSKSKNSSGHWKLPFTNKTSQIINASFFSNYRFDVHENNSPIVIFIFIFVMFFYRWDKLTCRHLEESYLRSEISRFYDLPRDVLLIHVSPPLHWSCVHRGSRDCKWNHECKLVLAGSHWKF